MDKTTKDEKKEKSLKRVFSRFSEKTTMHAAPYINSATFAGAKVIWSILLVAGITVMSLHLYFLIDNFVSWPKKTTLSLGFSNLELPAVTICNVNPVRLSKLSDTSEMLQQLVDIVDPGKYEEDYYDQRRRKRFVDSYDKKNLSYYDDKDDYDYLEDEIENADYQEAGEYMGHKDTLVTMLEQFTDLFMEEDVDIRSDIGHDIDKMLLRCSFGKFSCYPENFTLHQTQQYGNCYTMESKKMVVREAGPANGLTLMLYMENNEYLPGITDGYGARVHIHPKNTIPFPYESGFYVQTGHETTIALKQTRIERITAPHGNCINNEEFYRLYGKVYTRQSCQFLCRPTQTTKQCNCYNDYDYDLFWNSNIGPCSTKGDFECMYRVERDIRKKTLTCNCPDPCVDDNCERCTPHTSSVTLITLMSIASRQWPTDQYSRLLKASVCEDYPEDCDRIKGYEQESLGKNFLKIVIYYQQLNYQLIKEDRDIENSQFASDVGGAIGLWIGLSILSIFEIFQLIVEIIAYFIYGNNTDEDKQRERRQLRRDDDHRDSPNRPVYHVSDSDFPNRPVYHVSDSDFPNRPVYHVSDSDFPNRPVYNVSDSDFPKRPAYHVSDSDFPKRPVYHVSDSDFPKRPAYHVSDSDFPKRPAYHVSDSDSLNRPVYLVSDADFPNRPVYHVSDSDFPNRPVYHVSDSDFPKRPVYHIGDSDFPNRPVYHVSDSDYPKRPVYHVTDSYGSSDRYKPRPQLEAPQVYHKLHLYRGTGSSYSESGYNEPVYSQRSIVR